MKATVNQIRAAWVALIILCLGVGVISIQTGWDFLLKREQNTERASYENSEAPTFEEIKGFHFKPDFDVQSINQQTVNLNDVLKEDTKRFTLIHFWATWCAPCREELVELKKFRDTEPQFRVIQITVDFRWDEVLPYLKALHLDVGTHDYLDPGGKQARRHKITKFPETFLLSFEGEGLIKFTGPQKWTDPELLEFFRAH